MAKGSNSVTGRRSSSHKAKPYDANNSFVKKVATKVTDLIPQRSWISKWFNSSQNDEDVLDGTENPEEIESEEDIQKPPPLKRPCIRMDVTYPPGTFSIQPRTKTPLNNASPSKQQYSIHNETSEDFSEPAMAGPSGMSCLISSTPAIQTDIRNITPQRSELNSLVAASNNGSTNGMDDNSESSESTSGCSSLIPQTNRQEAPSNISYNSPFSNRKKFNNDKLTFTNHVQSPRSLFLDNNRDSLSIRRPSFNASVMTNTPDRASPLSSPFYSGNTTFGGANAAGLYKRGRNLFNSSNEIQLKVPRRTSVEVKPSNTAGVDSSGMSQTAKKILEALEHFSSPITDAKKIPIKMMNNTSFLSKKRTREETGSPTTKVGLRHLTRELTVPTVPDILKLRRRQKLQDTTVVARKIVSARSEPPPPQEYHLRTQTKEESKHRGKLKTKTNLDQEETVEPINLPNIPLPISSLPNFNFTSSANSKIIDKSCIEKEKEETFIFASPIKVTNITKSLKSINNFTFSSPINADNKQSVNSDLSLTPKKVGTKLDAGTSSCVPTVTQNFMWSSSSTAPRPKEKVKNGDKTIPATADELKSGSVMDVFCKPNKSELEKLSETKMQLNLNKDSTNNQTNSITLCASKDDITCGISKSNVQEDSSAMWECSECLIKNSNSETLCFACKTARPSFNDNKACESSSTSNNISKSNITAKDHFSSQFKLSSNQWECTSCYVRNKQTDVKCVACSALNPNSKCESKANMTKVANSDLNKHLEDSSNTSESNLLEKDITKDKNTIDDSTLVNQNIAVSIKPSKDTWECPCCMVRNVASVDSCPCCNTAKPSSGATKSVPLIANGFGDKFKKPEGAWNCDTCMLQNKAKDIECVACGGLKPGSKKPDNATTNTSSKLQFNFGIPPSTGDFKFGIGKADQQKTDNVLSTNGFKFGESQQSNQVSQFTFGIQKGEKKTSETLKSEHCVPPTIGSDLGFQVNTKSNEKTNVKQDSETVETKPSSSFSFGISKSESGKVENNKQSMNISSTTLPATFTFGVPKSEIEHPDKEKEKQNPFRESIITQVSKPNTETTESSTVTSVSTLTSTTQSNSQELKPNPQTSTLFSFGVPSSTVAVSSSISTSVAISLPPSTQSSFTFSETKPAQTAPVQTFGQIPTSVPASTTSNTFTFGENKATEGISATKTFGALPSISSGNSIFSSISSAPSLFGTTDAKTTSAFGTQENKTPTFGANASKSSAFSIPENKMPTFGSTENKPSIFGSTDAKIPVFESADNRTTPLFNPTPQAPTVTPTPTFSAPSATPSLFGSSVTPVFGNNASTFNTESKPNIFGSSLKPGETNTSNLNLFTFNASPAQPVAQSGSGFNFSTNTNSGTNQKPLFTFGSNTSIPQSNNVFRGTFNNSASNNSGFTFNVPKPEMPAFGQSAVTTPMFGASQPGSQDQPSSSVSTNPSNAEFNFGFTLPATSSEGFNFNAGVSSSAPSTGFNFNAPSTTPTFDPNTPPSFNFTGGNVPPKFSGKPQTPADRKFKKALRRMR